MQQAYQRVFNTIKDEGGNEPESQPQSYIKVAPESQPQSCIKVATTPDNLSRSPTPALTMTSIEEHPSQWSNTDAPGETQYEISVEFKGELDKFIRRFKRETGYAARVMASQLSQDLIDDFE